MPHRPNVKRLSEDRDLDGLIAALRYPEESAVRANAARALGEIGDLRTVESLIRSSLQDLDESVQSAARAALFDALGSAAETAITAYVPPDDTWVEEKPTLRGTVPENLSEDLTGGPGDFANDESRISSLDSRSQDEGNDEDEDDDWDDENEEEPDEEDLDTGDVEWQENDIPGLMAIIRTDHDQTKRIKAIRALSRIENTRAIDALASIAIWSEESRLRREARQALGDVYGDNLDELLLSYRQAGQEAAEGGPDAGFDSESDSEDEDDFDADAEEDEEEEAGDDDIDVEDEEEDDESGEEEPGQVVDVRTIEPQPAVRSNPTRPSTPVIQEEKPNALAYILLGVLFLLVVAGLIYFLTR